MRQSSGGGLKLGEVETESTPMRFAFGNQQSFACGEVLYSGGVRHSQSFFN